MSAIDGVREGRRVQAVIFDWAGTTIDHGSRAPAGAFRALFARHGIEATIAEAREPMGQHKRDHIAAMLAMPAIAAQWTARHGGAATAEDIEALFQEFIPLQLEALPGFLDIIPGVPETVSALRARGIKIGATTGYNEEMMAMCAGAAERAGYAPDVSVAVTDVPAGRPAPWMALRAAMLLGVYPMDRIVKVGDTVADVEEGLNAGMWTVAVTRTGNEVGLSREEAEMMPAPELAALIAQAEAKLRAAGAHYIIESAADVLAVIEAINGRLERGDRP